MEPDDSLKRDDGPYPGNKCAPDYIESSKEDNYVTPKFSYGEHVTFGDLMALKLEDGTEVCARKRPLKLPNDLELTYGQMIGFAGDLYGTDKPISDGSNDVERKERFLNVFSALVEDTKYAPAEVPILLKIVQGEIDAINKGKRERIPPSQILNKANYEMNKKLERATSGRTNIPSYLSLALVNFDHFGEDTAVAYNTGHEAAIQYAMQENSDLFHAYALNSFADHYLQDRFSSGHLRVPRRLLHGTSIYIADYCSKLMHDEDGAIGLEVSNPNGDTWKMYGDMLLFDDISSRNRDICLVALQASVDEVYQAWRSKTKPEAFKAWRYAPTLESAHKKQDLAPLFIVASKNGKQELRRRKDIYNRREHVYISNWTYIGTALKCRWSGLWNYPMRIDS